MNKMIGRQTVRPEVPPSVVSFASVVGQKEGEGPIGHCFDKICLDAYFGESSWEKAESSMLKECFELCCDKLGIPPRELDMIFSGDLLNQCVSSALALKNTGVRHFGLYGACSTMGEAMALGAMAIDGGFAGRVCAVTGSHFCSSERQYRFPLEYGGQRTPTAQWTVTGSGAVILQREGKGPYVTYMTPGRIVDAGITDASNMGSAMAPAAYETLKAHFADTGREPDYYDMIVTGDLGAIGHDTLEELFRRDGVKLGKFYTDCGAHIRPRAAGRSRRRLGLRLLGLGVLLAYNARLFRGQVGKSPVCADRSAHVADEHPAGKQHPRHMPCARRRKDAARPR